MVDNYVFVFVIVIIIIIIIISVIIVIVIMVVVVVVSARNCTRLEEDFVAAANERSERVADLAAGVRVAEIKADVDQRAQLVGARVFVFGHEVVDAATQQREDEDRRRVVDQ